MADQSTTKKEKRQKASQVDQSSKLYGIASAEISARYILLGFLSYFSAELGASYSQQSIIVSVRNVGRSFLQGFWGTKSDKYGRRLFLVLGYMTMGLTSILYIQIRSVSLFLVIVAIQMTVGSAAMPAFDSTVGDVVVPSKRGAFFGKVTSIGSLIAVFAILITGLLMDQQTATGPDRFNLPFLIGGICFLGAAMFSISLKETLKQKTSRKGPRLLTILQDDPDYRRLVVVTGVFTFAMSLAWPLFAFILKDVVFATGFQVSMMWAVSTVVTAITTRYSGRLSDRIGRKPLLVSGRMVICLVPFLYALTSKIPSWHLLVIAEIISGISVGFGLTALQIMSLDLAPVDQRAAYSGAIMSVSGITAFVGSLFAGILTMFFETQMGHIDALIFMLYIGALMCFLASIGFLFVKETAPSKIQSS